MVVSLPVEYSLYFHVPFCTRKCGYCHFYVIPNKEPFRKLYMDALRREWELRRPFLPKEGRLISVYFGGGTPSLLGPEAIEKILSWIAPEKGVEITIETNPETSVALFPGINRVSLGIQSFDDSLLRTLTRTHRAGRAVDAAFALADSGIENISIDLMYDLPGQTLDSWERTLERAISLPIAHLSLYNLTFEPHTSFYKNRHTLFPRIPDGETSLRMLKSAVDRLQAAGLKRYEISAFSKPGFHSRHNTGYWKGRPFLGFGPSAFSYWEGARFRNCANLSQYAKMLNQNRLPIDFHEKLPLTEALKEKLAVGLRLLEGVEAWPRELKNIYIKLCDEGFLEANSLGLTERGILFHDSVAEIIMA
ncbi:MAG: radical SAM family heme chaperone HemW [Chlamydiales bacterium]|nr:radical SAM family heme chaperone HemW [Chlamydiales bacterium]